MSPIQVFLRWLKKFCSQGSRTHYQRCNLNFNAAAKEQKIYQSFLHLHIVAVWSTWKNFCEMWLAPSVFLNDKNKLQLIFNVGQAWSFFYAVDGWGWGGSSNWFNYANSRVMPRKWSFLPAFFIPLHESKWGMSRQPENSAQGRQLHCRPARNYSPREVL